MIVKQIQVFDPVMKTNQPQLEINEKFILKDLDFSHRMFFVLLSFGFTFELPSIVKAFFLSFGNENSHNAFNNGQRFKLILWSIIGGTRGGPNRARILNLLITDSLNSHQIAKQLNLDHKTIRHHLKILTENSFIVKSSDESYGATYILTPIMQQNVHALKEIVSKMKGVN